MEFIEEILMKSQKNNKVGIISTLLAMVFFFGMFPIHIIFFNGSKMFGLIMVIGGILMPIIGYVLGTKLGKMLFKPKKVDFNKTRLYRKLKKSGYLNDFIQTINKEIDNENTIKYYDEIFGVGLLMTETWFVFIADYPDIVKTSEIVKISDELSDKGRSFMCLELKDKTYIRIDELSYDDICKEITVKYPDIEIGIGIIEE